MAKKPKEQKLQTAQGEELSVMEAVDELSKIAEIDHSLSGAELQEKEIKQEKVKQTFRVLHRYLEHLYQQDKGHFEDPETRQSVKAIMGMASEAAKKLDRFTVLFKGRQGEGGVQELKEFQDFHQFYLTKIMKKFEATLASEEAWEAEWGGQEIDFLDIQRRGLKDLETVRRDREYELFYIRKEDGRPFFNRNLMRHIRLVGEFDESIADTTGEDPFIRIKQIEDGQVWNSAKLFLSLSKSLIDAFFKEAFKFKEDPFIMGLTKASMALMLAANPRNLMQNTLGKPSVSYFSNFHRFLREALESEQYQRALETPIEQMEPLVTTALYLAHKFALLLFTRKPPHEGVDQFIEKMFERATHQKPLSVEGKTPLWLWNSLLEEDEKLRSLLKHFPNGPLMKTLDVIREGEEREGFDPIGQENLPYELFMISGGTLNTKVLRLPAPIIQLRVDKVDIVREFQACLRGMAPQGKKERFLLINLQNRTAWQEHARASALEDLQKKAEFVEHLFVVSLPMDTDFYYQSETYESLDDAKNFKSQIVEQLASGEECGFYFPPSINLEELKTFAENCSQKIHHLFFSKKEVLTRRNRLDFIELFYLFLILFLLEKTSSDYVSLTCKDAIDTGAVMSSALFSLLTMMGESQQWNEKAKKMLLYILYAPALMLRERAVDKARLHRSVSALSLLQAEAEAQGPKFRKELNQLFSQPLFTLLHITH